MWVKGYGFLSFGKNMSKNLNNKFSQKIIDSAKHVQQMQQQLLQKEQLKKKKPVGTGDLINNRIAG